MKLTLPSCQSPPKLVPLIFTVFKVGCPFLGAPGFLCHFRTWQARCKPWGGGGLLQPECVRCYLNFLVVCVLSPFLFVLGEQLSSEIVILLAIQGV